MVMRGCSEKFGLYYVNYSDPARPRIAKDSSHVMAEIIRTHHLPQQKYFQEGYMELGRLHHVQDWELRSHQQLQGQNIEDSSKKQNIQRSIVGPDVSPVPSSPEISAELDIQREAVAVVINED